MTASTRSRNGTALMGRNLNIACSGRECTQAIGKCTFRTDSSARTSVNDDVSVAGMVAKGAVAKSIALVWELYACLPKRRQIRPKIAEQMFRSDLHA